MANLKKELKKLDTKRTNIEKQIDDLKEKAKQLNDEGFQVYKERCQMLKKRFEELGGKAPYCYSDTDLVEGIRQAHKDRTLNHEYHGNKVRKIVTYINDNLDYYVTTKDVKNAIKKTKSTNSRVIVKHLLLLKKLELRKQEYKAKHIYSQVDNYENRKHLDSTVKLYRHYLNRFRPFEKMVEKYFKDKALANGLPQSWLYQINMTTGTLEKANAVYALINREITENDVKHGIYEQVKKSYNETLARYNRPNPEKVKQFKKRREFKTLSRSQRFEISNKYFANMQKTKSLFSGTPKLDKAINF